MRLTTFPVIAHFTVIYIDPEREGSGTPDVLASGARAIKSHLDDPVYGSRIVVKSWKSPGSSRR